uniref:Kazal-like domain-containing protein n=1 Tax=Timema poppense TaxID=170557 RepID=A0A7R9DBB6_TIMPO|nr:unnamed protein product [Timema poppensis]
MKALADDDSYATIPDEVQYKVLCNLQIFKDNFTRYFSEYGKNESEFIKKPFQNPFSVKPKDLPDEIQEEVIELQNNSNFKDLFKSGLRVAYNQVALKSLQLFNPPLAAFVLVQVLFISTLGLLLVRRGTGSLCRGEGCPEICPSLWQPLCAGVGGVETRTFSNMCQMAVHNCNQEAGESFCKEDERLRFFALASFVLLTLIKKPDVDKWCYCKTCEGPGVACIRGPDTGSTVHNPRKMSQGGMRVGYVSEGPAPGVQFVIPYPTPIFLIRRSSGYTHDDQGICRHSPISSSKVLPILNDLPTAFLLSPLITLWLCPMGDLALASIFSYFENVAKECLLIQMVQTLLQELSQD